MMPACNSIGLHIHSGEAGWGGVTTEARQAWLASVGSLEVPVDAWPEGALCDPVKMVFTDSSCNTNQGV